MGQINGLTWYSQDGGGTNLLASVPLGFNIADPDALEFTINPVGTFGTNSSLTAEGLVVDNLLNRANVTVTQGALVVTIPALVKDFVRLNPGQPVTVSSDATGFTRCFFFRGQFFASPQQTNDFEIQSTAMEERFTNGTFDAYLKTLRIKDAVELPIGTNLNTIWLGGKYRVFDPSNRPLEFANYDNQYWFLEVDVGVAADAEPGTPLTTQIGFIRQTMSLISVPNTEPLMAPNALKMPRWVRLYQDQKWTEWCLDLVRTPLRLSENYTNIPVNPSHLSPTTVFSRQIGRALDYVDVNIYHAFYNTTTLPVFDVMIFECSVDLISTTGGFVLWSSGLYIFHLLTSGNDIRYQSFRAKFGNLNPETDMTVVLKARQQSGTYANPRLVQGRASIEVH